MIISDHVFWIAAFGIYLFDHFKLIDGNEMLLSETMSGNIVPRLSQMPFEFRRKCLVILNPFSPFLMTFRAVWNAAESNDTEATNSDAKMIADIQENSRALRSVASFSFMLFFFAGPSITFAFGLLNALFIIIPISLAILLLLSIRSPVNSFGFPKTFWRSYLIECLFCPVYIPTILKRISWNTCLKSNGVAFAQEFTPAETLEEFRNAVETRKREFTDEQS